LDKLEEKRVRQFLEVCEANLKELDGYQRKFYVDINDYFALLGVKAEFTGGQYEFMMKVVEEFD